MNTFNTYLFGQRAKFMTLIVLSVILLFTCLGGRDIWTQEHRWADIVAGMLARQDFLHPYLGLQNYYDKPLFSYWLIAAFASLIGDLNAWALRLPSALAGLVSILSIYQIGRVINGKSFGLLAASLMLTTFYFLFWSRVASADMLNLAGSLYAVSWYIRHESSTRVRDYTVFFIILALTGLCKGLIGIIIPAIAVAVHMTLAGTWKKHLNIHLVVSCLPAIAIYLAPFIASSLTMTAGNYHENGLYLVYRENILRFFHPFDHKDPIYTYFIYLPIYTFPWTIALIPALWTLRQRWSSQSLLNRWIAYTTLAIFLFLTASGSRRSYYVLPLVPFTILFIANFLIERKESFAWNKFITITFITTYLTLFSVMDLFSPWYDQQYGTSAFSHLLLNKIGSRNTWLHYQPVIIDAESKLIFHLHLPPAIDIPNLSFNDHQWYANHIPLTNYLKAIPNSPEPIYITRLKYESVLLSHLKGYYTSVRAPEPPTWLNWMKDRENDPVAIISSSD